MRYLEIRLSLKELEDVLYGLYEKSQFYERLDKAKTIERDFETMYKETLSTSNTAFEIMHEFLNAVQKNEEENLNPKGT